MRFRPIHAFALAGAVVLAAAGFVVERLRHKHRQTPRRA